MPKNSGENMNIKMRALPRECQPAAIYVATHTAIALLFPWESHVDSAVITKESAWFVIGLPANIMPSILVGYLAQSLSYKSSIYLLTLIFGCLQWVVFGQFFGLIFRVLDRVLNSMRSPSSAEESKKIKWRYHVLPVAYLCLHSVLPLMLYAIGSPRVHEIYMYWCVIGFPINFFAVLVAKVAEAAYPAYCNFGIMAYLITALFGLMQWYLLNWILFFLGGLLKRGLNRLIFSRSR